MLLQFLNIQIFCQQALLNLIILFPETLILLLKYLIFLLDLLDLVLHPALISVRDETFLAPLYLANLAFLVSEVHVELDDFRVLLAPVHLHVHYLLAHLFELVA